MKKPLDGCLVIDLTTFVAAPAAGRLLADLGARVIKIEPPKGDAWRNSGVSMGNTRFSHEENPIFDLYNNGKDLISLNLKTEEGMAVMLQLLSKADVFITNNRPASLSRMGLDYETLHKKFPRLIYGIVLGLGAKGPDAHRKAFDTTAFWARSGFLLDQAVVMEDGQYEPVNAPSSVGDSYTGSILALQILAAILQRQKSGEGQLVSSTLYHVGTFAMATMIVKQQDEFGSILPDTRAITRHAGGGFECADGKWIYLATDPPIIFQLAGHPEYHDEACTMTLGSPERNAYVLAKLRECLKSKTCDQWMELLEPYDTPTVPMPHFADVSRDPQAWENDFIREVHYPTGYTHRVPTSPLEMEHLQIRELDTTKPIGQDTAKVLSELGYTDAQIAELTENGSVICN